MAGEQNYWQGRNRWGRRSALRAGALGSAGLAAAFALACGGGDDNKGSGAQATTASGGGAPAGQSGGASATAASGASTETPKPGGVLVQRLPTDPDFLDVHRTATYGTVWPLAPIFNQLVQFDPNKPANVPGEIVKDLADSWEQADPQTVVFKLKPGVKWHDGSDFTAEDIKVNIDWIRKPPEGKASPRSTAIQAVDAVETPDPLTVRIKLKRPNPSLLMNVASHYFAIGQGKDITANGEISPKLIGTGPFKFKSYEKGVSFEVEKNPSYHVQGRPYLDGMKWLIVRDYNTALTNLRQKQYHLFYEGQFTPTNQKSVEKDTGGQIEAVRVLGTLRDPVFMNARKKPFDDIRVRQAISMVIDRDEVMELVKEGAAKRGGAMLPGGAWALPEAELRKIDGYDKPNLDKAKALLREAGITGSIDVVGTTRTDFKPYAEVIQNSLKKVGINANIALADVATAQPVIQRGDYDITAWLIGINTDDPDAVFTELYTSNAVRNWAGIKDAEIDALFDKQTVLTNNDERKKVVQELEKKALEKFGAVTSFFDELCFARDKRVRNFTFASSLYTNRRMEAVWLAS